MDRTERRAQQIAHAKEHFAHHKAIFQQFDGISTLDWRHESGSSNYYVRYVFDEDRGCLYISGDLGSAVVQLTERATLQNLSHYINSVDYFTEKIQCSTNLYRYDMEIAKADLAYHFQDYEEENVDEEQENIFDEKMSISELVSGLLDSLDVRQGCNPTEKQCSQLSDLNPDYWEWIGDVGQYIDTRVICWLVGLQMAWEQMQGKLVDSLSTSQ